MKLFVVIIFIILSTSVITFSIMLRKRSPRVIAYFDIDDTLTAFPKDFSARIVQNHLNNGDAVGIITASNRSRTDICDAQGRGIESWMPDNLCAAMLETNFRTFNSSSETAGKAGAPHGASMGEVKGHQMILGKDMFKASEVILYDDNPDVLEDAAKVFPLGTFVCASENCSM